MHIENPFTIRSSLEKLVEKTVMAVYPQISLEALSCSIEYPRDHRHGDYAVTLATRLASIVQETPKEINLKLKNAFEKSIETRSKIVSFHDFTIESVGIFLNFKIKPEYLTSFVEGACAQTDFGQHTVGQGKRIIVEYSDPNIAKPLGAHHLIATVLGQAIYNLYQHLGFETIAINHLGDWGTQFGKLITAYKKWGDHVVVEAHPIDELLKLYVRFHDEAEKNPLLEDEARNEFLKLERGDRENRALWQWFVDVSLKYIKEIYHELGGITFNDESYMGESFYEDKMQEIIEEGKSKKVFSLGEKGALVAKYENNKYPPCLIVKSDGATLYATRDLATLKYRLTRWNSDEILYVVDVAQSLHFQQFFEVARLLGWFDEHKTKAIHVYFGRMRFPEGGMSTRKGNVVLLEKLMEEAKKRAYDLVTQKTPELSEDDRKEIAGAVGIGAIKYAILSQNRITNVVFTWDKILSLEGNSAPYLQYTHARACSILRKNDKTMNDAAQPSLSSYIFQEPLEIELARSLLKFQEHLVYAAQEYKPNLLANYLYDLTKTFNSFYQKIPVLQAQEKEIKKARLNLVKLTANTVKQGLWLLGGIVAPEKM